MRVKLRDAGNGWVAHPPPCRVSKGRRTGANAGMPRCMRYSSGAVPPKFRFLFGNCIQRSANVSPWRMLGALKMPMKWEIRRSLSSSSA